MTTEINWKSAGASLHQLYDELTDADDDWPVPDPDAAASSDEQRRQAQTQWTRRLCATYISVARANELSRDLLTLGAPMEVLTGASYATDELTHHLAMLVHLVRPFSPRCAPTIARADLVASSDSPSWSDVFTRTIELYVINLGISSPVYEAVSAVSVDPAVREMAARLAASTDRLARFGRRTLEWMTDQLPPAATQATTASLPATLAGHESLCHGNPELLDALAGDEFTLETTAGNLGTLLPNQIAVIFYDTLGSAILPTLNHLGCDAASAWQQHYQLSGSSDDSDALVAAVGSARN